MSKTQSERMAQYRARIRQDPEKWAAHQQAQRDYKRNYYQKTKQRKVDERKLKNKIRTRRYRQRKKSEQDNNLIFVRNEATSTSAAADADEAACPSSRDFVLEDDDPLGNFTHFKAEPQFKAEPGNMYGTTADESTTSASVMSQSHSAHRKEEENDMLNFFKSLIPDCNKLDAKRKRLYKFEILKRLNEHLDQQENGHFLVTYCETEYANSANLPDVAVDVKPSLI